MDYYHYDDLAWNLRLCVEEDANITRQLNIYNQLKSLNDYFKNCVFSDDNLQNGKAYILPMDIDIDLFEEEEYEEFTDPNSDEYDPKLVPFAESHSKHIKDGLVCVTLKAGTTFIYKRPRNNRGPYYMICIIDGYPMEWYDHLIFEPGQFGAVPFVIKA